MVAFPMANKWPPKLITFFSSPGQVVTLKVLFQIEETFNYIFFFIPIQKRTRAKIPTPEATKTMVRMRVATGTVNRHPIPPAHLVRRKLLRRLHTWFCPRILFLNTPLRLWELTWSKFPWMSNFCMWSFPKIKLYKKENSWNIHYSLITICLTTYLYVFNSNLLNIFISVIPQ